MRTRSNAAPPSVAKARVSGLRTCERVRFAAPSYELGHHLTEAPPPLSLSLSLSPSLSLSIFLKVSFFPPTTPTSTATTPICLPTDRQRFANGALAVNNRWARHTVPDQESAPVREGASVEVRAKVRDGGRGNWRPRCGGVGGVPRACHEHAGRDVGTALVPGPGQANRSRHLLRRQSNATFCF